MRSRAWPSPVPMAIANSCSSSAESSDVSLISRRYVSKGDCTDAACLRRVVLVIIIYRHPEHPVGPTPTIDALGRFSATKQSTDKVSRMYASFGQCRIKRTPIALARELSRQNWFFRHLPCIFRFLIFPLFRQFGLSRPAQRKNWRFCRLSLKHKNRRQFQLNADSRLSRYHPRRLCLKLSNRHPHR